MKAKLALLAALCSMASYVNAADAPTQPPASEKDVVVKDAFDADEKIESPAPPDAGKEDARKGYSPYAGKKHPT